jgi:hypothetical protein
MNRRMFLALGVSAALSGQMAYAQSFTDSVVDQLRRQGFSSISVGRTLLGRTRIVAEGNGGRREIILNPRTGEILRDFWQSGSGSSGGGEDGSRILRDDDRNDGSGRGRGRGGDDREDDREDDRSDREDNSGRGNSGSGGGGDDSDDDDT